MYCSGEEGKEKSFLEVVSTASSQNILHGIPTMWPLGWWGYRSQPVLLCGEGGRMTSVHNVMVKCSRSAQCCVLAAKNDVKIPSIEI